MGLTAEEKDWLTSLWEVDLNSVDEGDVVSVQERMRLFFLSFSRDKTVSGEYILQKPPKKPGGLKIFYICLIIIWMLVEGVDCLGMEEGTSSGSSEEMRLMLSLAAVFVLIRLLLRKDDREAELRKMKDLSRR